MTRCGPRTLPFETELDEDGEQFLTFSAPCRVSGIRYSLTVNKLQHDSWKAGALSQHAFPELNADQREFLQTGITPLEWEQMLPFSGEEE